MVNPSIEWVVFNKIYAERLKILAKLAANVIEYNVEDPRN
jgi:hypothetical protein